MFHVWNIWYLLIFDLKKVVIFFCKYDKSPFSINQSIKCSAWCFVTLLLPFNCYDPGNKEENINDENIFCPAFLQLTDIQAKNI